MSAKGGKRTLEVGHKGRIIRWMHARQLAALALAFSFVSGCSYGAETLPECFDKNIQPTLRAVEQAARSPNYKGGEIEIKHTLCSTHDDRLNIAEQLLASAGYLHERHIAELGHCIDVTVKSLLTAEAFRRQVINVCGIASASGVAYTDWSGPIGDHFLFVSGKFVSFSGPHELPK